MEIQIERPRRAASRHGKSIAGWYDDAAKGFVTKPIRIGPRASGVPTYETDAIIAARMAGKTDDEVRALVDRLHAERVTVLERLRPDLARAA